MHGGSIYSVAVEEIGRGWGIRPPQREGAILEREDEWVRIEKTSAFKELVRSKKAFIIPATVFFMVFYFGLPILAGFTTVLNVEVIGAINLAYIYAFAQFAMTWILMHVYLSKAGRWDELVDEARAEAAKGEAT